MERLGLGKGVARCGDSSPFLLATPGVGARICLVCSDAGAGGCCSPVLGRGGEASGGGGAPSAGEGVAPVGVSCCVAGRGGWLGGAGVAGLPPGCCSLLVFAG